MSDCRVVFMGTPDFAVPALDVLVEAGFGPIAVVSAADKPARRGQTIRPSAVKRAAEGHGIPVLQPESLLDAGFAAQLAALECDIIAVVAFRILPPEVYSLAAKGAFNLHASLLPSYRGAAPIQRALMDGATKSGVTTFFLKPKVDTGDMILQMEVPIGSDETGGELHDRLATLGAVAVVETVRRIQAGSVASIPQDDSRASPAPKIFKDDLRIDWSRSAGAVHNHIRALSPYPAAWTTLREEPLKILRSKLTEASPIAGRSPGEIMIRDGRMLVACGSGEVEVLELQRGGRRAMSAADFLNGFRLTSGDLLA